MGKGKWMHGASPTEPVSQVAREALRARLRTVAYYLPLAANKSDRDVEYVHQLRVSTRRAVALVRLFRELLPPRRADWLDKQLKRIRRAAGEARDLDVLGRRIAAWIEERPTSARTALLVRIEHRRDRAQKPVHAVQRSLRRKQFAARLDKIVERVRWRGEPPEPSFAGAAGDCLRKVADPFFHAAEGDLADLDTLHCFRITAKHLRYSMEVFATAFPPEFRSDLYPQIEEVQTRLGEIHDEAAAIERFRGWIEEWDGAPETSALTELIDVHKAGLARTRQDFIRWWTPERSAELRQRFEQALAAAFVPPGEKYA